jgi:hypothetical protein
MWMSRGCWRLAVLLNKKVHAASAVEHDRRVDRTGFRVRGSTHSAEEVSVHAQHHARPENPHVKRFGDCEIAARDSDVIQAADANTEAQPMP